MPRAPISTIAAMLTAMLAGFCSGSVINVPDDYDTIQLGISNASTGDTVLIAPGTYSETVDFLGRAVTVGSWYLTTGDPSYVDVTIIDGGGTDGPLVTFDSGEDTLSVLAGLALRDGRASDGGGILCEFSSPRISSCVLSSNYAAHDGGGAYVREGSPVVEDCLFEANEAAGNAGGGFGVRHGSPRIEGCVFSGNIAVYEGGAIFCEDSSPVIRDNVVDGNTSSVTYAGGIMSRNCVCVIRDNVISNNHTYGIGGGLFY